MRTPWAGLHLFIILFYLTRIVLIRAFFSLSFLVNIPVPYIMRPCISRVRVQVRKRLSRHILYTLIIDTKRHHFWPQTTLLSFQNTLALLHVYKEKQPLAASYSRRLQRWSSVVLVYRRLQFVGSSVRCNLEPTDVSFPCAAGF